MKSVKYGVQALAITAVLAVMGGCKSNSTMSGNTERHVGPYVSNPRVDTETKMQAMAAQLDAITMQNVHNTLGGQTAPHFNQDGFFLLADFLYWRADVDNLDYGYEYEFDKSTNGERLNLKFNWNPGFRVGIGYLFGQHDQWDLKFCYTWFHNSAHASEHNSGFGDAIIYPTWVSPLTGRVATEASAHWKLHYNVFDAELGRDYFISRKIALRPFAGLRGAWINQNYDANYQGTLSSLDDTASFDAENDYHAGGFRTGGDMMWHFTENWGIVSKISASLLYGQFEVEQSTKAEFSNGTTTRLKSKDKLNKVRTNMDGAIGLMYQSDVNNNKQHISLSALYELTYWFNQNEMYKINYSGTTTTLSTATTLDTQPQGGDLGMQGLTIKFQYNF